MEASSAWMESLVKLSMSCIGSGSAKREMRMGGVESCESVKVTDFEGESMPGSKSLHVTINWEGFCEALEYPERLWMVCPVFVKRSCVMSYLHSALLSVSINTSKTGIGETPCGGFFREISMGRALSTKGSSVVEMTPAKELALMESTLFPSLM